jgi:uncharacterized protein (DUF4415 family)
MSANRKDIPIVPDSEGPLTDEDGEVRELTEENFFRRARPTKELFPDLIERLERMRGQRGPQKAPTKEQVTLRLDRDVVESYRAGGPGWQTRINDDLAKLQKRRRHG